MRTLSKDCFGKDWIEAESRRHRVGNTFFEKTLYAFELLGRLSEEPLDFVFKGGTSLLLRLPIPRRLSIDVDIVCREAADKLERVLKKCAGKPFVALDEDTRRHNHPPRRRHWNFSYKPIHPAHCPEPYIILDVLEEDCLYPDVESVEIRTRFFTPDHDIAVRVPTVENLLADKLTTFAPKTIGQEYSDDHPEKIAKHLFDIGELFNAADNIHSVKDVYATIATAEIGYRRGVRTIDLRDCPDDTIAAAHLVTALAVNQELDADNSPRLRRGIAELSGHLVATDFNTTHASVAAGKAALLASLIKFDRTDLSLADLRYDASKLSIVKAAKPLSDAAFTKLAQVSPEAFYYWWQIERIRT